jgi:hypothetical protein
VRRDGGVAGDDEQYGRRKAFADIVRELHAIHRSRHLHIGQNHPISFVRVENGNGFVRVLRIEDPPFGMGEEVHEVEPDQSLSSTIRIVLLPIGVLLTHA